MIKIITDSASDFALKKADAENVVVIPMQIQFGDTTYLDKYELNANDFYTKLIESDELPTTSQITPYAFEEAFEKIKVDGDSAVVILMSGELSGTAANAMQVANDYENIYVVDSKNVTIGEQCLLELAISLRKSGLSAKEISEELLRRRDDVKVIALLDTLEYLKKGGRISATTAWAGGLLSIKPVVSVQEGKVAILGKARGSKNGNNMLMQLIEKYGIDFSLPVLLGYTGLETGLLDKYVEDSKHTWAENMETLPTIPIGSTIGTHVGPGAIAVAFFANNK